MAERGTGLRIFTALAGRFDKSVHENDNYMLIFSTIFFQHTGQAAQPQVIGIAAVENMAVSFVVFIREIPQRDIAEHRRKRRGSHNSPRYVELVNIRVQILGKVFIGKSKNRAEMHFLRAFLRLFVQRRVAFRAIRGIDNQVRAFGIQIAEFQGNTQILGVKEIIFQRLRHNVGAVISGRPVAGNVAWPKPAGKPPV